MNDLLRIIFIVYFTTHIPITLCLDLQGVLPSTLYPQALKDFFIWYVSTFSDYLMTAPQPVWLKSFLFAELIWQLPFFFVAAYGLIYKKNWLRIPSIVYGTHVATTVWPILAEIIYSTNNTIAQKQLLFSFYFPYLLVPALLSSYMSCHVVPFPENVGSEQEKKKK